MTVETVTVEQSKIAVLTRAYQAFNARDIPGAVATMQPGVEWPNSMEGGTVHGHAGVRDYWTRQWGLVDPRVEPVSFDLDEGGRVVVGVHQVVRDLAGNILLDQMVRHAYSMEDALICSMEIRD